MKKHPEVYIKEMELHCPECDAVLTTDVCGNCGQEIDTEEMWIDIQVGFML